MDAKRSLFLSLMCPIWAACGRLAFDPVADAPVADAPSGAFGTPTPIGALSDPAIDDDASATGDLLELYFNSTRAGSGDIWFSKRARPDAPWGTPLSATELNSAAFDGTPVVSLDGLTILFNSDRAGALGSFDIWTASRPDRSASWSAPVHVPELSTTANEGGAQLDASQRRVVLHSSRTGTLGRDDIWIADRASLTASFSTPVQIAGVNTPSGEGSAQLLADGLELVFSSDRPGGAGGNDLYRATRGSLTEPFAVAPFTELNTPAEETDPWISPDGNYMLFVSNQSGDEEIFETRR
jgi:hypothetical protein